MTFNVINYWGKVNNLSERWISAAYNTPAGLVCNRNSGGSEAPPSVTYGVTALSGLTAQCGSNGYATVTVVLVTNAPYPSVNVSSSLMNLCNPQNDGCGLTTSGSTIISVFCTYTFTVPCSARRNLETLMAEPMELVIDLTAKEFNVDAAADAAPAVRLGKKKNLRMR